MTVDPTAENCSLRERKRRATLAAIEDAATALVLDRGFDDVTVEDICERASISKRTFFNYVPSKEAAVVGSAPRELPEEALRRFEAEAADGMLVAALRLLLAANRAAGTGDRQQSLCLVRRRREIFRDHPELAHARISTFTTFHLTAKDRLTRHLLDHPEQRRLPDLPAEAEAKAIAALVVSSINLGMTTWLERSDGTHETLDADCVAALDRLSDLLGSGPVRAPGSTTTTS